MYICTSTLHQYYSTVVCDLRRDKMKSCTNTMVLLTLQVNEYKTIHNLFFPYIMFVLLTTAISDIYLFDSVTIELFSWKLEYLWSIGNYTWKFFNVYTKENLSLNRSQRDLLNNTV